MIQDRPLLRAVEHEPTLYSSPEQVVQLVLEEETASHSFGGKNDLLILPLCMKPLDFDFMPHRFNFIPWKLDPVEIRQILDEVAVHVYEKNKQFSLLQVRQVLQGNLKLNLQSIKTGLQISSLYKKESISPTLLFNKAEKYRTHAFTLFLEKATELIGFRSEIAHSFEGGDCRDFISFMDTLTELPGFICPPSLENILKAKWNDSFDAAFFAMLHDKEIDFYRDHQRKEYLSQTEVINEWEDAKMKAFNHILYLKKFIFSKIKDKGISLYDEEQAKLLRLNLDVPDTFKNKNILELLLYIKDMNNGATYQERFMAQHIVVNAFHELSIERSPEFILSRHLATQIIPDRCFTLPEDPKEQRLLLLLECSDGSWESIIHTDSDSLVLPTGTKVLGQEKMRSWEKHPEIWVAFSSRVKSKASIMQKLTARGSKTKIQAISDFPDLIGCTVVTETLTPELQEELEKELAEQYLGLETKCEDKSKYALHAGEYVVVDTIHKEERLNPNSHTAYGDIKVNGKRGVDGCNIGVEGQIKFLEQYTTLSKRNSEVSHEEYVDRRTLSTIRYEFPNILFGDLRIILEKLQA